MLWAMAVRLASRLWPMEARSAVIVVPMLSPRRIGMAPARPMTEETPSGPAWEAKLWRMAIVAEELCTIRVMQRPSRIPKIGISLTFAISSVKTGLLETGFITELMIWMPSNRRPK